MLTSENISKGQFSQVYQFLVELAQNSAIEKKNFSNIQALLNVSLSEIVDKCFNELIRLSEINESTYESFHNLLRQFTQLCTGINICKKFIIDESLILKKDNLENKIIQKVQYFYDSYNRDIENFRLKEAEKKFIQLEKINQIIGNVCVVDSIIQKVTECIQKIKDINTNRKQTLIDLFSKKTLNDFSLFEFNPREIIQNLGPENDKLEKELSQQIIDKFNREIEDISLSTEGFEVKQKRFERLLSLTRFTPEEVEKLIEDTLAERLNEIKRDHENLIEEWNKVISSESNKQLIEQLKKIKQKNDCSLLRMCSQHVSRLSENIFSEIANQIFVSATKLSLDSIIKAQQADEMHRILGLECIEKSNFINDCNKSILLLEQSVNSNLSKNAKEDLNRIPIGVNMNASVFDNNISQNDNSLNLRKILNFVYAISKIDSAHLNCNLAVFNSVNLMFDEFDSLITQFNISLQDFEIKKVHLCLKKIVEMSEFSAILSEYPRDLFPGLQQEDGLFKLLGNRIQLNIESIKTNLVVSINDKHEQFKKISFINNSLNFEKDRKNFIDKSFKLYENLREVGLLISVLNSQRLSNLLSQIGLISIDSKVLELWNQVYKNIDNKDLFTSKKVMVKFDSDFSMMALIQPYDVNDKLNISSSMLDIQTKFEDKINQVVDVFNRGPVHKVESLINLKILHDNILCFQQIIYEVLDNTLRDRKKNLSSMDFSVLVENLKKDTDGINIIETFPIFKGYANQLFNKKIANQNYNFVINNLQGDNIGTASLYSQYEIFEQTYQSLVASYLKNPDGLSIIRNNLFNDISSASHKKNFRTQRSELPFLMSNIFALYTLMNSENIKDQIGDDQQEYLFHPHPGQVIAIFRTLGIGYENEKSITELKSNLAEVKTGEGKSYTIAISACILALWGYNVDCVCYSAYLTERDYLEFKGLFDYLGVSNRIKYGTFTKLCEELINQECDLRSTICDTILKNNINKSDPKAQSESQSILIVDEVDVFFSPTFYGELYSPVAHISTPEIKSLIKHIWKNRTSVENKSLRFQNLQQDNLYKNALSQFNSAWTGLFDDSIRKMLHDLLEFKNHTQYVIYQDKIGYKDQDEISTNVSYGYLTMFAYLQENENLNISNERLEEALKLNIRCGNFSYAEIPKRYKNVLGFTGTLSSISDTEKATIRQDYGVESFTLLPSIFSTANRNFKESQDVRVVNESDYLLEIERDIRNRLKGRNDGQRCVLVAFKNMAEIAKFRARFPDYKTVLNENANKREKDRIVKSATDESSVTLITSVFTRGTDFKVRGEKIEANGGAHIIATYIPESEADHTQLLGRVGRYGIEGSYSFVLLENDLEKFEIEWNNLDNMSRDNIYKILCSKRKDLYNKKMFDKKKFIEDIKNEHDNSEKLIKSILTQDFASLKSAILNYNRYNIQTKAVKTIIAIDMTCSMSHLHSKVKNNINIMFDRAADILQDAKIPRDVLEMQIVMYRNYNSNENEILISTGFENDTLILRNFLSANDVSGGWGNEAIELALNHAKKVHKNDPINQIILIGDYPPNTRDEVAYKRKGKYDSSTRFPSPCYWEDELAQLVQSQIPVHTLYLTKYAKSVFEEIAKRSQGKCSYLDVDSSESSKVLTDLVTENLLNAIGKVHGNIGETLVTKYRERYGKQYS